MSGHITVGYELNDAGRAELARLEALIAEESTGLDDSPTREACLAAARRVVERWSSDFAALDLDESGELSVSLKPGAGACYFRPVDVR